jgi:hypothetical protein
MGYRLSPGSHQTAMDYSVCGFVELATCQCLQVCGGETAIVWRSGVIGF